MFHDRRTWCVSPVETPEELAEKLTEHSWCICTGFEIQGYLFLNDATSEDGAQEYAVVRRPTKDGEPFLQVEKMRTCSRRARGRLRTEHPQVHGLQASLASRAR